MLYSMIILCARKGDLTNAALAGGICQIPFTGAQRISRCLPRDHSLSIFKILIRYKLYYAHLQNTPK